MLSRLAFALTSRTARYGVALAAVMMGAFMLQRIAEEVSQEVAEAEERLDALKLQFEDRSSELPRRDQAESNAINVEVIGSGPDTETIERVREGLESL